MIQRTRLTREERREAWATFLARLRREAAGWATRSVAVHPMTLLPLPAEVLEQLAVDDARERRAAAKRARRGRKRRARASRAASPPPVRASIKVLRRALARSELARAAAYGRGAHYGYQGRVLWLRLVEARALKATKAG